MKYLRVQIIFLIQIFFPAVILSANQDIPSIYRNQLRVPKQSNAEDVKKRSSRTKRKAKMDSTHNCDFTTLEAIKEKCHILLNPDKLSLKSWFYATGDMGNYIGGPILDGANGRPGGYAFADMSHLQDVRKDEAWMFTVPSLATNVPGLCLTFQYAINGISFNSFRIFIAKYQDKDIQASDIDSTFESADQSEENEAGSRPVLFHLILLFETQDLTKGIWKTIKLSFITDSLYSLVFVAKANHRFPQHRGYVTVDNFLYDIGSCGNDCLFEHNFCKWINTGDKNLDEFDWSLSRSSTKRGTGPSRDQSSWLNNLTSGGYIFIDSGHPRKVGDKAALLSPDIAARDVPMCFKFWVHMYGKGIGTLVLSRMTGGGNIKETIWEKSGGSEMDRWIPCQVTVTYLLSQAYRLIFLADVGQRELGDIAIDSLEFKDGPCPQVPPDAAQTFSKGDCTFMINTCEWTVQQPYNFPSSSTPMIEHITRTDSTPPGKTLIPYSGEDYYMGFDLGNKKHKLRQHAYLISPVIEPTPSPVCFSFWVCMFTNNPLETYIGALTVIYRENSKEANKTIWRIENKQYSTWEYAQVVILHKEPFQLYIQGTKGTMKNGMIAVDDIAFYNFDCKTQPPDAFVSSIDCSFDSDECGWRVERKDTTYRWKYEPNGVSIDILMDHTYGGEKSGFVFFESLNVDVASKYISPKVEDKEEMCFTFYYANFFKDKFSEVNITSRSMNGVPVVLWTMTQAKLPPKSEGDLEVEWNYAQVGLKGPSEVIISARVTRSGWALDDIKLIPGGCRIRPDTAKL